MAALIRDFNELSYTVDELNEDGMPKKFRLKGRFQHADLPNGNGRVYPRAVLESSIQKTSDAVTDRRMLGELDHPNDAKIHLEKVSHVITKLQLAEDGQMYGEAEVLPTASGKILESLLRSGVKLGISSRGFGSTKKNGKGLDEVQNDFKLVTFDIVSDPSTPNAFPQAVYENNEYNDDTQVEDKDYTSTLDTLLEDVLSEGVQVKEEVKQLLTKDADGNRFYIVEGEKDSYGNLNFHVSHDYHILVKNEDFEERVGINATNLQLVEDVYGNKVHNRILSKIEELGYNPTTLNWNKED
jgi:hypothetical protein